MIRQNGLPLRLLILAVGLAELDRINTSGVFCLKVERIVASYDERILISGCHLPILLAGRPKFVGGTGECRESPETMQGARERTTDRRVCTGFCLCERSVVHDESSLCGIRLERKVHFL